MKLYLTILLALVFQRPLTAETFCAGPKGSTQSLLYFHGIDTKDPGSLELRIRERLARVAMSLKIRIAAPRANLPCRNSELCWDFKSKESALASFSSALDRSQACVRGRPLRGFLGFSNGGYFLNRVYGYCGLEQNQFAIVVGAAGKSKAITDRVKSCGRLLIHQGDKDLTYKDSFYFYKVMEKRGFPVSFHPFKGGHEIREEPLKRLLRDLKF